MQTLVIIIVFVISSALLIAHFLGMGKVVEEGQEGLACHLMLGLQDVSDELRIVPTVENQCRTISKTLPENGRTVYEAQKELANMIANTAWILHHGNINNVWGDEFFKKERCMILYQFTISSSELSRKDQLTQLESDSLTNYLSSATYKKIDDIPFTYFDYVVNHPDKNSDVDFTIAVTTDITIDDSYVIAVASGNPSSEFMESVSRISTGLWLGPLGPTYVAISSIKDYFKEDEKIYVLSVMSLDDALEAQCFTR